MRESAQQLGKGKQQFNVYLSSELVRQVKHAAVDESDTLSSFVETALLAYLEHLRESGKGDS